VTIRPESTYAPIGTVCGCVDIMVTTQDSTRGVAASHDANQNCDQQPTVDKYHWEVRLTMTGSRPMCSTMVAQVT